MNSSKDNTQKKSYATVIEDDGVNYRDIASVMSEIGYPMNHSSARNYVIKIIKKFVKNVCQTWNINVSEHQIDNIAKSAHFQSGIADVLQAIEQERRRKNN